MYFRRAVLVLAAWASCGLAHANNRPNVGLDIRRQQRGRIAEPKATVPTKAASLVATSHRGGGKDSQKASIVLGLILALNSGFINGCCLSGAITANKSSQAVAAVTASWTNSALGAASGNNSQFQFLGKVILSFISGSAIAGFFNPKPSLFSVDRSEYGVSLAIGAALMVVASKLVQKMDSVKTAFLLCAMANGIQNSVTSTMTGNLCRTSHYTGISSDMGTFIGQILAGNKANVFKLKVFAALATCFWAGGFVSYGIGKDMGANSLLVSAAVYGLIALLYPSLAKQL